MLWLFTLPLHTFHIETLGIEVDDDVAVEVDTIGGILLLTNELALLTDSVARLFDGHIIE